MSVLRFVRWIFVPTILVTIFGCSTTEHPVSAIEHPAPAPATQINVGRVNDDASVLSVQEKEHITKLLADYEHETSHQLAVVTVKSLAGESIESFSLRTATHRGLGLKGIDNGILVVVAPNDRKARIELGRGFEEYISDSRAQEIITTQMLPAFRQQQYAAGIERGLTALMSDGRVFVVRR